MRWLALAACMALALPGCGEGGESDRSIIAFLMANGQEPRAPFTARVAELCPGCAVLTENAEGDAGLQQEQAEELLQDGADVLVVQPVDGAAAGRIVATAHHRKVPVIGYEAAIRGTPPDYAVVFDDKSVGRLQAQALLDRIGDRPGRVVMLNGPANDGDATLDKVAAAAVFFDSDHHVVRDYDSPDTTAATGRREMSDAIAALGPDGFAGVYAASDDLAEGARQALKDAGLEPAAVPVTGSTVRKPVDQLAEKAAEYGTIVVQGNEPPTRTATVPVLPIP